MATLNFDEEALKTAGGSLYQLYLDLYNGNVAANSSVPKDSDFLVYNEDGTVDETKTSAKISEYNTILMKNAAYLEAKSVVSNVGGSSGGGDTSGCLLKVGDDMNGNLGALHGLKAGWDGVAIFQITTAGKANITGDLDITGNASVSGKISVGNDGIYFNNTQTIYYADEKINIALPVSAKSLTVDSAGSVNVGNVSISASGIKMGDTEFYNSTNSNLSTVDWNAKDLHVYGKFVVDDGISIGKYFSALNGFEIGSGATKFIYTTTDDAGLSTMSLAKDMIIETNVGFTYNGYHIVQGREVNQKKIVSFSAPGMIMNLGDKDGTVATTKIDLISDIYNSDGSTKLVSSLGDGNFPNSFSAGCAASLGSVIQSYYLSSSDYGILFNKYVKFGGTYGPGIYTGTEKKDIVLSIPYTSSSSTTYNTISVKFKSTDSLFADKSIQNSVTAKFETAGEFFCFSKPVEAAYFSVISTKYKTRLMENELFFGDGTFIEGVTGGIQYNGSSMFSGSMSSLAFSSGFAGSGWSIRNDELYGGIGATFDTITVRKKMRIYELEVQKTSCTNGSLWVCDACSGDIAEEVA
jgi:hypothetical protein